MSTGKYIDYEDDETCLPLRGDRQCLNVKAPHALQTLRYYRNKRKKHANI